MLLWTLPATERTAAARRGTLMPPADVIDDGDAYRVIIELPGVVESDVVIDLEGSTLKAKCERKGCPAEAAAGMGSAREPTPRQRRPASRPWPATGGRG